MNRIPRLRPFSLIGLLVILSACSKYPPAEGIVYFNDQPLPGANLTFIPMDKVESQPVPKWATAYSDEEGRFRLSTVNKMGAMPARYKVVLSKKTLPPGEKMPSPDDHGAIMSAALRMKESLPTAYTKESTTTVQVEVTPEGTKDLEIKLVSKP